MDAEQARPLYAFFVVSLIAGLLIGQGIRGESLLDVFTGSPAAQVQSVASSPILTAADPAPAAAAPRQTARVVTPVAPRRAVTTPRRALPASVPAPARAAASSGARQLAASPLGQSVSEQAQPQKPVRGRTSTSTRLSRTAVDTDVATATPVRGRGHRPR